MSTYLKLRHFVFSGILASAGLAASACGSDKSSDGTIVIPRPDGSTTAGGSGGEGGAGGSTGGTGGATGGSGGSGGDTDSGTPDAGTGGSGGSGGGTGGTGGSGGSGGTDVCQASGSYDNKDLPLLPDGGLPPL
jgi:hypothetical protein